MKSFSVCMISCEFPPKCAGIGNNVYTLSKNLVQRGHRVTVLTRGSWFRSEKRYTNGVEVYELPFIPLPPPFHIFYHGFFINRLLKRLEINFDLIHLHSPLVPKVNSNLPKVLTVHSLWLEESKYFNKLTDFYSLAVKIFKKSLINTEKATLGQADIIVTYSREESNLLKNYDLNLSKIHVVEGFISLKLTYCKQIKKKFDVCFVGRLNYRKGVMDLIKASKSIVKKHPKTRFVIIGDGPLKTVMQTRISKLGLNNRFKFLGFIPHDNLPKLLSQVSIFVVPSLYEPFGLVTGEAMACKLPVVGTMVGGTKRLVIHGKTGLLVPTNDPYALSKAIITLLENEKLCKKMGDEGRKRILKNFNERTITGKIEKLYNLLC